MHESKAREMQQILAVTINADLTLAANQIDIKAFLK